MTNKETIREEWARLCRLSAAEGGFDANGATLVEKSFIWWLSKIEQIRKEDVERVRTEIQDIEVSYGEDSLREFKAGERMRDCILEIPSLQTNMVEVVEEYHKGKLVRCTANGVELPIKQDE